MKCDGSMLGTCVTLEVLTVEGLHVKFTKVKGADTKGFSEGLDVGIIVGCADGCDLGTIVGVTLGWDDGFLDGKDIG